MATVNTTEMTTVSARTRASGEGGGQNPFAHRSLGRDEDSPWNYDCGEFNSHSHSPSTSSPVSPIYELEPTAHGWVTTEEAFTSVQTNTESEISRPRASTPNVPPLYLKGMKSLDMLVTMESKPSPTDTRHSPKDTAREGEFYTNKSLGEADGGSNFGTFCRSARCGSADSWMCTGFGSVGCGGGDVAGGRCDQQEV